MSEPVKEPGLFSRISADVKLLARRAATFGAALAIFCHLLPPHYRAVCDHLASLCTFGK